MRASATLFLLGFLAFQQQCQIQAVTPDGIKQKLVTALLPYFPDAKAVILPEQHAILGLTCVHGAGAPLVIKIMNAIGQDPEMTQELGMIRFAPLLGGARYKYFVLAFDGGWIWYDIDTRRMWEVPLPETAAQKYRQECGFAAASCSSYVQDQPGGPMRCADPN